MRDGAPGSTISPTTASPCTAQPTTRDMLSLPSGSAKTARHPLSAETRCWIAMLGIVCVVSNSRLVYSTDGGDRRERGQPAARGPQLPNDGVVRVFREKGGRRGKTVTVIRGLPG